MVSVEEYPSTHKKCMQCGTIMLWEDNCECLKAMGREMRRKARETWSVERKRKVVKPVEDKEDMLF